MPSGRKPIRAQGVAKLYDLKTEPVVDNGFLEELQDMIPDSNPMVSCIFLLPPSRLITHSGRRQHGRGTDRRPHFCHIAAWNILLRSRVL